MAKTDFKSVDEYIDTFPENVQDILQQVRTAIRDAVPESEEVISYQIPAVKFHGWIFYFSAYKNHFSLACPPPTRVFDAFKEELSNYPLTKSTIKFPLDEPVPVSLIGRMSQFQASQNLENESTTESAKKS